jgi:hypothetical protein
MVTSGTLFSIFEVLSFLIIAINLVKILPVALGRRTNPDLAQPQSPLGKGFRSDNRQRQTLPLHPASHSAE